MRFENGSGGWKTREAWESRRRLWFCFLGFFVAGAAFGALITGIRWWRLQAEQDALFQDYEAADNAAMAGLTCWDITRNLDEYWWCMVRGEDLVMEGKKPKQMPNETISGYEYYPRKKMRKATSPKKHRMRRQTRNETNKFTTPYEPYDSNFTLTIHPLLLEDYEKEFEGRLTHDYFRKSQLSEVLYRRDVNSKDHQTNPPWSYEGFFPPKQWHDLNIMKFYQPVKQQYTLRMASYRDFGTEALFMHPEAFNTGTGHNAELKAKEIAKLIFWSPKMVEVAYHNKTSYNRIVGARDLWVPQYILDVLNNTHYKDSDFVEYLNRTYLQKRVNKSLIPNAVRELMDDDGEETLAKHNPQAGFYSEMRFLIPPGTSDKELIENEKAGRVPFQFNRPSQNYVDFRELQKYAKDLIEDYVNKTDMSREKEYRTLVQVSQWFVESVDALRRKGGASVYEVDSIQFPGFNASGQEDSAYLRNFLRKLQTYVEEQRKGPQEREYYSLPLLPKPFKMCRHSEPSPLNILPHKAQLSSLSYYSFPHNFCKRYPVSFRLRDDGTHVLIARFQGEGIYADDGQSIRGGIIKGQDLWLDEIHIHIGKTDTTGSEHKINGTGSAMELQFIFTITGSDPEQPFHYVLARQAGDLFQYREKLVLIIALLVEVVEKPEDPYLFEPLAQAASRFRMQQLEKNATKFRGYTTEEPVWALSDFMPSRKEKYYTYRGSLTIPPCFSYVFWSVYTKKLQISRNQFQELQTWPMPETDDSGMLAGNVRSMEDFFVEKEEEKGLTQAQKAELRAQREGRVLLESDPVTYRVLPEDYIFDYYAHSPKFVTSSLLLIILVLCLILR